MYFSETSTFSAAVGCTSHTPPTLSMAARTAGRSTWGMASTSAAERLAWFGSLVTGKPLASHTAFGSVNDERHAWARSIAATRSLYAAYLQPCAQAGRHTAWPPNRRAGQLDATAGRDSTPAQRTPLTRRAPTHRSSVMKPASRPRWVKRKSAFSARIDSLQARQHAHRTSRGQRTRCRQRALSIALPARGTATTTTHRYSARLVNIRYGSLVPRVVKSSISTPAYTPDSQPQGASTRPRPQCAMH